MRTQLARLYILIACIATVALGFPLWRAYSNVATIRAIPIYVGRKAPLESEVGTWSAANLRLTSDGRLTGTIEMAERLPLNVQFVKDILFIQIIGTYASTDLEHRPFGEFIPIIADHVANQQATFVVNSPVQVPTATFATAPPSSIEVQLLWCRVAQPTDPNIGLCHPFEVFADANSSGSSELRFDQSARSGAGKLSSGPGTAWRSISYETWLRRNIPVPPAPTYSPVAYPAPTGISLPSPYPAPTLSAYP